MYSHYTLKSDIIKMLTILITLGSTREYIDPVRFLSNASSGKMGKALTDEALKQNCKVIAVKGPCNTEIKKNKNCKVIDVISARDMLSAVKKNLKNADIFMGAAAVSDYRPATISKNKIKKQDIENNETFSLQLVKNPDIIKYVSEHKNKKQISIGFALETKNLLKYAETKLKEKDLDMIVANKASAISSDKSQVVLIFKNGKRKTLKLSSKQKIAKEIINESIGIFKNNKTCQNGN